MAKYRFRKPKNKNPTQHFVDKKYNRKDWFTMRFLSKRELLPLALTAEVGASIK